MRGPEFQSGKPGEAARGLERGGDSERFRDRIGRLAEQEPVPAKVEGMPDPGLDERDDRLVTSLYSGSYIAGELLVSFVEIVVGAAQLAGLAAARFLRQRKL